MRISDWSSDVCSSDLFVPAEVGADASAAVEVHRAVRAIIARHIIGRIRRGFDGRQPPLIDVATDPTAHGPILSDARIRSEEHTSELQSLMLISYAVFCLKNKKK